MDDEAAFQDVKLVDQVTDLLHRFKVMTVVSKDGKGGVPGPATFQVFGRGPANRQIMLDVILRLLVASEKFKNPIHCGRTYKLVKGSNPPQLAQGYTIAGICVNKDEINAVLGALDLTEWHQQNSSVDEALFFVPSPDGNGVVPSGMRNIPATSDTSPGGKRGVYPTMGKTSGGGY